MKGSVVGSIEQLSDIPATGIQLTREMVNPFDAGDAIRYAELRSLIDGASESMTHEDAINTLKFWGENAKVMDMQNLILKGRIKELERRLKAQEDQIHNLTNAKRKDILPR